MGRTRTILFISLIASFGTTGCNIGAPDNGSIEVQGDKKVVITDPGSGPEMPTTFDFDVQAETGNLFSVLVPTGRVPNPAVPQDPLLEIIKSDEIRLVARTSGQDCSYSDQGNLSCVLGGDPGYRFYAVTPADAGATLFLSFVYESGKRTSVRVTVVDPVQVTVVQGNRVSGTIEVWENDYADLYMEGDEKSFPGIYLSELEDGNYDVGYDYGYMRLRGHYIFDGITETVFASATTQEFRLKVRVRVKPASLTETESSCLAENNPNILTTSGHDSATSVCMHFYTVVGCQHSSEIYFGIGTLGECFATSPTLFSTE
jgi:hypothetical protein